MSDQQFLPATTAVSGRRTGARVLRAGAGSALASAAAAMLAARVYSGSGLSAINATSHVLWGRRAARRTAADVRYTLVGAVLHAGSAALWATLYEALLAKAGRRDPMARIAAATLTAGAAYATDYCMIPKRLTPGWELRMPARVLPLVFAALAIGLAATSASRPSDRTR